MIDRSVQGFVYALLIHIIALLFCSYFIDNCFPVGYIPAYSAGFKSAVRKLFLGLEAFVAKLIHLGLCMNLPISVTEIEGARFIVFGLLLFHLFVLIIPKINLIFDSKELLLFKKVYHQSFTLINQKFYSFCHFLII